MDWGYGNYERTAARLEGAARTVISQAAPLPGERLVDLGTGTGNAAILAAELGADVIGIDPAIRLIEVATARADQAGLDVTFAVGEAAELGLPSRSADVIVSVFGLIFAPDENAAAAEIARVLNSGGRLVFNAWLPTGTIADAVGVLMRGFGPAPAKRFEWHEASSLDVLFGGHGLVVSEEATRELTFVGDSPAQYLDTELANHPLWRAGFEKLRSDDPGAADRLRDEILSVFVDGNEDPGAFRVTSGYRVFTLS